LAAADAAAAVQTPRHEQELPLLQPLQSVRHHLPQPQGASRPLQQKMNY
jgi:hypothetical protein